MKKCPYCGAMMYDQASFCPQCGNSVIQTPPPYGSNTAEETYFMRNNAFDSDPRTGKSRGVAALLALIIGSIGVQYFYLGKTTAGFLTILLSLVTCGFWQIITLIQGILMLCMDNRSFCDKYVYNNKTFPLF